MRSPAVDFQQAVAAFQARNFAQTKKLCARLLKRKQLQGDVSHLLALTHKIEGDHKSAKQYFERSLAADPRQAVVCANYANLLAQDGRVDQAETMYRRATTLDATQVDAWYNWANLANSAGRFEDAIEKIDKAIGLNPNDARLHILRGMALRGLEDYAESIAAFDTAIGLATLNSALGVNATENKAITYRAQNEPKAASDCLAGLIGKNIEKPEIHFIKACAHYDAGEYDEAERELQSAIEMRPAYVDAHEALNKLYWERGEDERFLSSYEKYIAKDPRSKPLRYSYAAQLILADRKDEAKDVLSRAVGAFGPEADLLHALGVIVMGKGQLDEASKLFAQAISKAPDATRYRIDKANVLIREEDYGAALGELDHAGKVDPLDQEVWAYRGLCWRLMGDERAEWLNDYERLVNIAFIDVPDGYDDLEHFMHELRTELQRLHKTQRQPLDQSVRNGTQTVGTLLSLQTPVIQQYREVLSRSIQEYIDALPDDPEHPFLNRNKRAFVHTGSWSVKLGSGGFHTNHMHPQGWLSNCTYVSVPGAIRDDDPDRAGWIRFGETSLELGDREHVGKAVRPKEGMRVLFPSFMWHGTYPFDSDEHRITVPSDIMPKP